MTRAKTKQPRLTEQEERLANDLFCELLEAFEMAMWQAIENREMLDASFRRALLAALDSLGCGSTTCLDTEAVDEAIETTIKDREDGRVKALADEAARANWWPEIGE